MNTNEPHVLCIDGHNFLHRARSGFSGGEHALKFNFFRNFKAIVHRFAPTRIYFVMEGHPQFRYDALPSYKANRKIPASDTKKHAENAKFFEQVDHIMELVRSWFPVSVVRHENYECDDTIFNLIDTSSTAIPWTVVSNDSDFTQLLNKFEHVRVFNPMKKVFVETPSYDYVLWKALRGDGSDCIPGIKGIGDKTAQSLVEDPDKLVNFLNKNPQHRPTLERNVSLISFARWDDETRMLMTSSSPQRNWNAVKEKFEEWQFASLLKESYWDSFVETFDHMFGVQHK